jgi:hypothetical protein
LVFNGKGKATIRKQLDKVEKKNYSRGEKEKEELSM